MNFVNSGIRLRWLSNAGFEFKLPNGKTLLVDPWLDEASYKPVSLDEIDGADYMLLSHIHFDHADSVRRIQQKFPHVKLFMGDLSVDSLADWQDIDISHLYRMRGGEVYQFDDVRIEAFTARHTESPRGTFKHEDLSQHGTKENSLAFNNAMWFGSMEMLTYLITFSDGMKVLVWGGMPAEEQIYRLQGLNPEIAFLHCSPKIDFRLFARMVQSINARMVVPHHCDGGIDTLKMRARIMQQRGPAFAEKFVDAEGLFREELFLDTLNDEIRTLCPTASLKKLEHHKWYHFGLAYEEEEV